MTPLKKVFIGAVVLGAGLAVWGLAAAVNGQPDRHGPLQCTKCKLGRPVPDVATQAYLKTFIAKISQPKGIHPGSPPSKGDVFIVCSSAGCVDYVLTYTGNYEGTVFRKQSTTSPGSGGGGSGSGGSTGGGGGTNLGGVGGCVGKCTGIITTRPPVQIRER